MNISTKGVISALCRPLIRTCEWMGRNMPVTLVRIRYYARFRRFPNLKDPRDLNEKILWLKLFSDVSRWVELADKYRARKHIEDMGLGKYLVRLYGKWDRVEDIDFAKLPDSLIFKLNRGDGKGTNRIVRNLREENLDALRKLLKGWLELRNVGDLSAEPHYRQMKPCIIAEELLEIPEGESSLVDYKIWCINGKPQTVFICDNRDMESAAADVFTYSLDWKPMPEVLIFTSKYHRARILPRPENLDEMLELASRLSEGFPELRVDLYNIKGHVYFGELTFTSLGGMMDYFTHDYLNRLGRMADISGIRKVRNL